MTLVQRDDRTGVPDLPNLLVLGTAKSGTTTLRHYLSAHPQAGCSVPGEPDFFARDDLYARGLDYYRTLFRECAGKPVRAEKSWTNSVSAVYPAAIERIFADLPPFRALYLVRHPIKRAISMWTELRDAGAEIIDKDFETAVFNTPVIYDSSRYLSQYAAYRDRLPKGDSRVMFFEDMVADQAAFFDDLCDYLGIEHFRPEQELHVNSSAGKTEDGVLADWARRAGIVDLSRRLIPDTPRKWLRGRMRHEIVKPEFSPAGRDRFVAELGDEFRGILAEGGKPADFWDLDILS